ATASHHASPRTTSKATALLKSSRANIDRAVRYILDSDANFDRCDDDIWLMGPPSSSSSATSTLRPRPDTWPPSFHADFTSRIWLTYRSHFTPIRDSSLQALEAGAAPTMDVGLATSPKRWPWMGGEKGWTSDAGWGCMLRTGQSMLATALVHLHLGRDFRRPLHPAFTPPYATYVQILTWFFDSPDPLSPFSVHRMALAGKDLGKDVGQWFGPSTAAGALKTLTQAFPPARLGVSVARDAQIFESDVFAASRSPEPGRGRRAGWGDRAVLVLIGIRLGLDGVNPIYYETIKTLFTFPQSVGIAGGRPSSSYYFVGQQADALFYLDPHHTRPAVPLRMPADGAEAMSMRRDGEAMSMRRDGEAMSMHDVSPPPSMRSYISPPHTSPPPSTRPQISSPPSTRPQISSPPLARAHVSSPPPPGRRTSREPPPPRVGSPPPRASPLAQQISTAAGLTPLQEHLVTAYTPQELRTFHCERVRKLPLSGLDPSMLIGFLVRDEDDWKDLRRRIA
ncbi:peptidase C54, partial [Vararia minispora EC-137]